MAEEKYDLKKAYSELYKAPQKFVEVQVLELCFLAVDGKGDPNTATEYAQAVEALYGLSYTLKFASKKQGKDYVVAPLEGLWWAQNMDTFVTRDKSAWEWTMLIAQPAWVEELVEDSRAATAAKKELPALDKVRWLQREEGLSVQILHIGSYDDEAETLDQLHHSYIPEHGYEFNGDHHEIYLSDARKTAPEKLRTILRQPVRKK